MAETALQSRRGPALILVGQVSLPGDLHIVPQSKGVVVFAHGSGSSRFSPRNRFVADVLHKHGISTLLIDLLTADEERLDEQTREWRFDIPLLARRLVKIGEWLREQSSLRHMKIGYFGSSTGGAAALIAAAENPDRVAAVVSRGGRVDLAKHVLPAVKAPTLLIVGALDTEVLALNEDVLEELSGEACLEIIPGASHLFEEPGTLEQVAQYAAEWFAKHFDKHT